jgi:PD-(D/E)XK nuclease superfamily
MSTSVEKLIRRKRNRKGVLVPMIEEFMERPVDIESPEDVNFLTQLAMRVARREHGKVFSPSQLGSCLRRVYLGRNHKQEGIIPQTSVAVEPHYYFLNGNFLHLKWQFVLYKMQKKIANPGEFDVIGYEIPILSKRKDHGGTIDAIVRVEGEPYAVDFKGLNVQAANKIMHGEVPGGYAIQLTDYMILWNSQRPSSFKIQQALLIVENKGGPDNQRPIALHETTIRLQDYKRLVNKRLEILRQHEQENKIPDPECVSTGQIQFQSCPFSGYCRKEVQAIQRKRENAVREHTKKASLEVARPSRDSSARRNPRRR